jgi:GT2 family glycosyltransferase
VVATFNRAAVLSDTLTAIEAQTRPPDEILVVDNASTDDTLAMLTREHPQVVSMQLAENGGASGGLAAGFARAFDSGADFVWVGDDDTTPAPDALRTMLAAAERVPVLELGVLALSGGTLRHGFVRHLPAAALPSYGCGSTDEGSLHAADFVIYDGGLVTRRAYEMAGTPRADFFHDFGDLEYSMRVGEHGLRLVVLDAAITNRQNLGSGGGGGASPPWRGYYRTRNQLRAALDRRSPSLVLGWLRRDTKLLVATVLRSDRKWERVSLRIRGIWDACANRLGRRVEPGP